ncbi:MAG TPA: GNAT family N-acetyltransferase [Candidatus Eremiobacteraceae bacterium]|nr:GNAT family N-acetyltransferase [Candidatus Eremiobacteraceae bacterium]
MTVIVRSAALADLDDVRRIYNLGIAERRTLDTRAKSAAEIALWFGAHDGRFIVLVAENAGTTVGWASLNRYSQRAAHAGIADLSIYVDRPARGQGIGNALLAEIEDRAMRADFDKIVLMTFPDNRESRSLFERRGYREIGIFKNQGRLDGRLVDTLAMEKIFESGRDDAEAG